MPHVLIRHKVTDFANWKPMSDAHGTAQKTSGSKGARLFRTADNPSETVIPLGWSDLDSARRLIDSEDPAAGHGESRRGRSPQRPLPRRGGAFGRVRPKD
jgi:hypothetical protein